MKKRPAVRPLFLLPLLTFVLAASAYGQGGAPPAASANSQPPPEKSWCTGCSADGKTTPRAHDGHPDLSGFYNWPMNFFVGDPKSQTGREVLVRTANGSILDIRGGEGGPGEAGPAPAAAPAAAPPAGAVSNDITCSRCDNPPYKPEFMAKVKEIGDTEFGDASPYDPQYDCKPLGVPRGSLRGSNDPAMQVVQNDQVVAFLYEDRPGPYFRVVYIDGRPHPKDLDESYFGDSIGHWDGDTLVVDVTGLNDDTWLGSGTIGPKYAMMHSNQEHVIERWTRKGDTLTYEAIVEDPVMFTKPWVMSPRSTQIAPGDAISPQMCVPFDKNHLVKKDGSSYVDTGGRTAATVVADAAAARGNASVAGKWNVTVQSTIDGPIQQQWNLQQSGDKVTGTATGAQGQMPVEGTVAGAVLNATITDGAAKYAVIGTISDDHDIDGTIKMGKQQYIVSGEHAP